MMDYISMLTDEEIMYICTLITGKNLKKHFQKKSSDFNKIRPGFRPNGITDDEAIALAVHNRDKTFIYSYLNKCIKEWLDEIDVFQAGLVENGEDREIALVNTIADCVFCDRIDIYFKLTGELNSPENIQRLETIIRLLLERQKTFLSNQDNIFAEKQKWKDLEKKYECNIEALKIEAEKTKRELNLEQEKFSAAKTEIQALRDELSAIQKLALNTISSSEMIRDEDYLYTSLCMVVMDYDGRIRLDRLSDIVDGVIIGHHLENTPNYNKLYAKDVPSAAGFIGIWDWTTVPNTKDPTKEYILSTYNDKYYPIEIVILSGCESVNDLLEQMKIGFSCKLSSNKVIFAFWNGNSYEGLLCESKSIDTSDNKIKLESDVFSLPMFEFPSTNIFSYKDLSFYRAINIGKPKKIVRVKEPLEVIKEILVERITWATSKQKGLTKKEYQKVKNFLVELPTEDIYQNISIVCECSVDEAKMYVEQFIQNAGIYLESSDIEGEILSQVVENHPELLNICKRCVSEDWMLENSSQISEANAVLENLKSEIKEQNVRLEQLISEYSGTQLKLDEALIGLAQQEQIATDVEQKVADRIVQAKKDVADFIVDQAFYQTPNVCSSMLSQPSSASAFFKEGIVLPLKGLESNNNLSELQDTLKYELLEAGVSEKYVVGLAAYMYSAYVNRAPLLLAGPCAREIADAFSAALFGRLSATLNCDGDYCDEIFDQCVTSEDDVVVLESPFGNAWNRYLPRIFSEKSKFFIAVNPYAEDLQIEPQGLLNYMLPIITELFVDKFPNRKFIGGYLSNKFKIYSIAQMKPYYNKLLTAIKVKGLSKHKLQQILTDMHVILEDNNADYDFIFALLPCAYLSGKTDVLKEHLYEKGQGDTPVSTALISYINNYLGEFE